jgi:sialidase-1
MTRAAGCASSFVLPFFFAAAGAFPSEPLLEQQDIFTSGEGGYHTYRIPALLAGAKGTVLAFCEGRKDGRGDAGDIDLLLRRSTDGGESWGAVQVLVDAGPDTAGNPAPVLERGSGRILLLLTRNPGDRGEAAVIAGKAERTVWITSSSDEGSTWAEPRDITSEVKKPDWTWYATGPGHGIQLESGRLVIPCDHVAGVAAGRSYAEVSHSHVILSDDGGKSWRIGGIVDAGTNESTVVETAGGALYINCRNYVPPQRRAYAWSRDGGLSFEPRRWDDALPEPICQASLVRLSGGGGAKSRVLFANPASTRREKLAVRISYDDCRTWSAGKPLHAGPAAYSDLAVLPDGTIGCLYERGERQYSEKLTFARFNLEWLTDGKDTTGHEGRGNADCAE